MKLFICSILALVFYCDHLVFAFKTSASDRFDQKFSLPIEKRTLHPKTIDVAKVPETFSVLGRNLSIKIDALSRTMRLIHADEFNEIAIMPATANQESYLATIKQFVDHFPWIFGVKYHQLRLVDDATLIDAEDQFFKFKVQINGIIIEDSVVDFRFKKGRLVQINNQSFVEARADHMVPTKNLHLILATELKTDKMVHKEQVYRVIPQNQSYKLVLVDVFSVNIADKKIYNVQIESGSGKIFEIAPTRYFINGNAHTEIYPRYWQDEINNVPLANVTLNYDDQTITTNAIGGFSAPANKTVQLKGFSSDIIKVNVKTGALAETTATVSNDEYQLNFLRNSVNGEPYQDQQLAQAMIYQHVHKIVAHAQRYISSDWFAQQLPAYANHDDKCNAYWDQTAINFFNAGSDDQTICANTALIADVIYHEWGHGLDQNTGGIEDGAFSEGIGDIMSLLMTKDSIVGKGFTTDGQFVRDLAPDKIYPQDRGLSVHDEGLIIGSTFYDLYQTLNLPYSEDDAMDLVSMFVFKSIMTASKYTDVYSALLVIDDDDGNLTTPSPHLCIINKVFTAHGLATEDRRCMLGKIDKITIDDSNHNNNGILEPGETVTMKTSVFNDSGDILNNLKALISLGNNTAGFTLINDTLTWDEIPANASMASQQDFQIASPAAVPCGHEFKINYKFSNDQRTIYREEPFLIGNLIGKMDELSANNLPQKIKDRETLTVEFMIDDSQWLDNTEIYAAYLQFDVAHSYIGDILVTMQSPSGKTFEIFDGNGPGVNINYDQNISSLLKKEKGKGKWQLIIKDRVTLDDGQLNSATLSLQPAIFKCESSS